MGKDKNKKISCHIPNAVALPIFILVIFAITGFKMTGPKTITGPKGLIECKVVTECNESKPLQPENGEYLYNRNCIRCHGIDGTKGWLGAHNLKKSVLGDSAVVQKIRTGKGFMPSFKKKLTQENFIDLLLYIKRLRRG